MDAVSLSITQLPSQQERIPLSTKLSFDAVAVVAVLLLSVWTGPELKKSDGTFHLGQSKRMDPRLQHCGFAKLVGDGVEHYMQKYDILLGRKNKSIQLDVVLGENTNVSRKHARIWYNFEKGHFELEVYGKNGVMVDSVLHTSSSPPVRLDSQMFIQIGDKSFYFLLPKVST